MGLEKAGDQRRESPMNIHVHAPAVFMARECWGNETLPHLLHRGCSWVDQPIGKQEKIAHV